MNRDDRDAPALETPDTSPHAEMAKPSGTGEATDSADATEDSLRGELPPDFDEAMFAAELESEFHKIKAEIDRINLNEKVGGPTKRMLVQRYREHRKQGRSADPNRPPWRVRLDTLLEDALDRVVEDGLKEHPDGTISLSLNSQIVGTHGVPIITAMLDGLRDNVLSQADKGGFIGAFGPRILQFIDNFRTSFAGEPPPGVTPPEPTSPPPEPAAAAPAFSFDQLLKGFVGAIQNAQRNQPPQGSSKAAKPSGKTAPTPRKGGPQTTTVRVSTPLPPSEPTSTTSSSASSPPSSGPTINLDLAGLLGAVLQQVKLPPMGVPKPTQPPAPPSAPAATPPSEPSEPPEPTP